MGHAVTATADRNRPLKSRLLIGTVLVLSTAAPGAALADGRDPADPPRGSDYYFAFDESALRRDIARIRYFYIAPEDDTPVPDAAADAAPGNDMVFLGGPAQGGFVGFWDAADLPPAGPGEVAGSWFDRTEFGFDWRPYVADTKQRSPRKIGRLLTAGDVDHVGVRADLTALVPTATEEADAASAWRVTGMLGATSLSLASGAPGAGSGNDLTGDLYWDIGVGWSSGPVSLSAGYESTYRQIEGVPAGMAVLSFGADYAVLPGLSVYGELNVVDDPALPAEQGLGTVIVLGTGLNF